MLPSAHRASTAIALVVAPASPRSLIRRWVASRISPRTSRGALGATDSAWPIASDRNGLGAPFGHRLDVAPDEDGRHQAGQEHEGDGHVKRVVHGVHERVGA